MAITERLERLYQDLNKALGNHAEVYFGERIKRFVPEIPCDPRYSDDVLAVVAFSHGVNSLDGGYINVAQYGERDDSARIAIYEATATFLVSSDPESIDTKPESFRRALASFYEPTEGAGVKWWYRGKEIGHREFDAITAKISRVTTMVSMVLHRTGVSIITKDGVYTLDAKTA